MANEHNNATLAGFEATNGHLSALLDEGALMLKQLRVMVDGLHLQWSNAGVPERGEYPLLDSVDDWLADRPDAMLASPAPAIPQGWVDQMLTDARYVFDAGGPETPQEIRDVIEYVASWIAAYRDKFSATKSTAPAVPVTCGNGCDCLAQCGDAYAHAGLSKPRQAEATSQGWPFGELSDGQIMAAVGRMGELVNYLKLGQQWDGICNLVRQIIRERYTLTVTPAPAPAQGEPFGYFRAEPFGWTDCSEDAEGAIALYERPQESELRKELDSANDFIKSLADLIQKYETMLGYRTTNAPEGAYALAEAKGESSLNTELDLACADFTCQHDFALDTKSSIRICLKCGTPERLSKNAAKPAQEVSDKHEREMLEVIDERDRINEWADQLADAIAKHTGYEIGEHTSENNPWRMALNALVCHEAKQEVGLTDEEIEALPVWSRFVGLWPETRKDITRAIISALRAKGGK